ncbi:MAG: hypothetical protein KIS91_02420 [Anaerolineae bacterium]|nr:hypothetical protein [Anaerolineae bacterium]
MDTAYRVRSLGVALFACLALAVVLAGGQPAQAASIVYVVPGGASTQTGVSWGTAKDLAAALVGATPGDELWVKAGTYKPTAGADRNATFALKSGVAVYGGFAGTETTRGQRNWQANVTLLSGDIGVPNNAGDNSYHVVTASGANGAAILDGFTIRDGSANGLSIACPLGCGGGVYTENSAVTLSNLSVVSNSAAFGGGGVATVSGSPTLTNVILGSNTTTGNGGGMFTFNGSAPTLTNVTFSANATTGSGNGSGGGLFNYSGSRATLTNVLFSGNSAVYGGGMTNYFGGSATLTNATFSGNIIRGGKGGGLYNANSGSAQIRNSILWGDSGSEIVNDSGGSATVTYSLVQGGYPGARDADPLFISADNLRLQAGSPAINAGSNSFVPTGVTTDLDGSPRIVGDSVDMGAYEFQPTCPAANPATLYVNIAVVGGVATGETWMDAYPVLSQALQQAAFCPNVTQVWVAQGAYTPTDRSNPIDPRSASFALKSGVAVYGGFVGGETDLSQRNWQDYVTTLSGEIGVPNNSDNVYHVVTASGTDRTARLDGFTISGGNAANGTSGGGMVNINGSPTLANLVFSANFANNGGGLTNEQGSAPALSHVTFSSNGAVGGGSGGGVYNSASSPTLTNVVFSGNFATNGGGLANANGSNAALTNVTFSSNAAIGGGNGGGMSNVGNSEATLINATFSTNSAFLGGGLDNETGRVTLTNAAFLFNSAVQGGGGVASFNGGVATLTNVTFNSNVAAYYGALYSGNGSSAQVLNSILWGDRATTSGPEVIGATVSYSIVQGSGGSGSAWWAASFVVDGGHNLDANPMFIAPPTNARLGPGSSAINAGNNDFVPTGVTIDLDGNPRIVAGTVDMGAYEASSPGGNLGTGTPTPTETPLAATATPTAVAGTSTPVVTVTPAVPTGTATPTATASPIPTSTPSATATPAPTATPTATTLPIATSTPPATATLAPTATPVSCNPNQPGSVCGGMVIVRAFIDFRCDGFFNAGTDWPLAGTSITASLPDGAMRRAVVDSAGNALITGVSLAAGQQLIVRADDPRLPAWVAASGFDLAACAPTEVAVPVSRFSTFGTAHVDFRWNIEAGATP